MGDGFQAGDLIDGRFRLERLLGEGGMGQVFEAIQLSVDRRVAIKTIRDEADSATGQERFFREARALSKLSHPGVVQLVDFGREEESAALWIAMEFIEGLPLSSLLSLGRVRVDTALEVARQMSSALSDAHAHGIVHRDLKPDNVMLRTGADGRLQVKLVDFGIALPTHADESKLTKTGAVAGTPYYMSPEQAQALEIGPSSDLYSLGVILFEMLVGQRPFQADTPLAVMLKHVSQKPPKLAEVSEMGFDGRVESLVGALLEKEPAERPQSGEVVSDRIDAIGPGRVLATPNATTLPEFLPLVVEPTPSQSDMASDGESDAFGATLDSSSQQDQSVAGEAAALSSPLHEEPAHKKGWIAALVLGAAAIALASAIHVMENRSAPDSAEFNDESVPKTPQITTREKSDESRSEISRTFAESQGRTLALDLSAEANALAWEASKVDDEPPSVKPKPTRTDKPAGSKKPKPSSATTSPTFVPDTSKAMLKAQQVKHGFSCVGKDKCQTVGSHGAGPAICSQNSTCKADCEVGGCLQRCTDNANCVFACSAGGCQQFCGTTGTCKTSCSGGGCVELEY